MIIEGGFLSLVAMEKSAHRRVEIKRVVRFRKGKCPKCNTFAHQHKAVPDKDKVYCSFCDREVNLYRV
jgi:hypothetical protein